jgi:cytochrome c55X
MADRPRLPVARTALLAAALLLGVGVAAHADVTPERRAELLHLLRQDCGACHGITLKGGLGPALTPQALAGKSEAALEQTILAGRPGTPMPPWAPFLTPEEVTWLVGQLRDGIGDGH